MLSSFSVTTFAKDRNQPDLSWTTDEALREYFLTSPDLSEAQRQDGLASLNFRDSIHKDLVEQPRAGWQIVTPVCNHAQIHDHACGAAAIQMAVHGVLNNHNSAGNSVQEQQIIWDMIGSGDYIDYQDLYQYLNAEIESSGKTYVVGDLWYSDGTREDMLSYIYRGISKKDAPVIAITWPSRENGWSYNSSQTHYVAVYKIQGDQNDTLGVSDPWLSYNNPNSGGAFNMSAQNMYKSVMKADMSAIIY